MICDKMNIYANQCPWMRISENKRVWCKLFNIWADLMIQQYPFVCEDYECYWQ